MSWYLHMQGCVKINIGDVNIIAILWLKEEVQNVQVAISHTVVQGCITFLIL